MIPKWMTDTDPGTWIGHLLLGLAGFWLGYLPMIWTTDRPAAAAISAGILCGVLVVAWAFWYREGDHITAAARRVGWRQAIRTKLLDGWMDWVSPLLGAFCDINLILGGFSAFVASLIAALTFIAIVALFQHNTRPRGR